ncbi:MAG TPA: hypothetical protein VJ728_14065, partial [Candidatus Binataceae bacterium]|nr:hypothetical protein [Candidatus Binataceae bacterium]
MTSFEQLVFFPAPVSQGAAPPINGQLFGGCHVVGLNQVGTPFAVGAIQPGGNFNGIHWIRVYSNPGGVTGLDIQLNGSNAVHSYGRDSNDWPGNHWVNEYTFDSGEYIVYTMLSLNDAGYLGRIELVTNLNQLGKKAGFAAGNPDFRRKYTMFKLPMNGSSRPAAGTLMGVAGTTDTQHITTLGLVFLPPIQTMVLQNPVLDLSRAQISEVPVVIQQVQPMTVGDSHAYNISAPNNSHTESSSFNYGTSLTQGFKYTVEMDGGSEMLGFQVKQGLEFSVDLTQTWEWDHGVEDTVSVAF